MSSGLSVEVVGGDFEGLGKVREGPEVVGIDRGHAALANLHHALDKEKGFGGDGEPMVLEGLLGDEDVSDAALILQGDEAVPLRGLRALAADDHAGDLEVGAMGEV